MRSRTVISWAMGLGPALAWLAFALWHYGPSRGYGPVFALSLMVAVGIMGLTAVFLAYLPRTAERLGLRRFAAWLRTWWDEDAR